MGAGNTLPDEQTVEDFLACETHAEKCAFFHAHPELKTVFREIHFPKAEGQRLNAEGGTREPDNAGTPYVKITPSAKVVDAGAGGASEAQGTANISAPGAGALQ